MVLAMTPVEAAPDDTYISFLQAREMMGATLHDLYSDIFSGAIRIQVRANRRPKCNLPDVQKLVRERQSHACEMA